MNTKLIVSIFVLVAGLLIATSAHAQVAISKDGVTFPDDSEQYTGVPNDCPHSDSIVWDTDTERWLCESELPPTTYAIGDRGPAGGIVFYITDAGLHAMEAAPFDIGFDFFPKWGCAGAAITGADGTAIGSGAQNTVDIIAGCPEQLRAARLAASYTLNGFTDWFLPSQDELNELYLQKAVVGGFAFDDVLYWSSSESSASLAWAQSFGSGTQNDVFKGGTVRVRAVRAF